MKFDTIIIGGGLAGLTCGLRLAKAKKKVAVVSGGLNSQNFASGSIDLLGFLGSKPVTEPFDAINELIASDTAKAHPYTKTGIKIVRDAIDFLAEETAAQGLELFRDGGRNHFKITPLGALRPTYLSQRSIWHERLAGTLRSISRVAILGFDGYRDFHPAITAANLRRHPRASAISIESGFLELPDEGRNQFEFRSVDIARIFERDGNLRLIAEQIGKRFSDAQMIGLPCCIGVFNYNETYERLCELTGKTVFEIPTPPPSLPGMRLDEAVKSRYKGFGMYMAGDRILSASAVDGLATCAVTESAPEIRLEADSFVLATGSFLGGGLVSTFDEGIREPLFGLAVDADHDRSAWYSPRFFAKESHPFLSYGVATDRHLRAKERSGKVIQNLFCAGAVLSGYDPVREGSGGGVAAATGYAAAERILKG